MEKFKFVSINSLLAKFHRDYRNLDISEGDIIDWIGDALDFMKMPSASEHALFFGEVTDYYVDLPARLHFITQIARDNHWTRESCDTNGITPAEVVTAQPLETLPMVSNCDGTPIIRYEMASYQPTFNLNYVHDTWAHNTLRNRFEPIRLANSSLFGSLVCRDEEEVYTGRDEYTVEGDRIKFSFREGFIVMPYIRQRIDEQGLPMIPDDAYAMSALTYYVIWKINEREAWSHRQGAAQLAEKAQIQWNSYILKFKNKAKMPMGVDDYQDLMEQSKYQLPNTNRYYGFFGKLNTPESLPFKQQNKTYNGRR